MNAQPKLYNLILSFIFLFLVTSLLAQKTSVRGKVIDDKTKVTMPYVNVQFDGTNVGVTSDIDGNFYFDTKLPVSKIRVTSVGYKTFLLSIKSGEFNEINVNLQTLTNDLDEVVVKVAKYRNRGNAAVELIKKVIEHKDQNRKENISYLSYRKYEKVEFAMNNISDKVRKGFIARKMPFIFDNVDTNKATGKVNVPFFLRENLIDVYSRNKPKSLKQYIRAEKNTTIPGYVDDDGISNSVDNMYREVDFYKNTISLLSVDFTSPISPIAPVVYRFYILDTVFLHETPCIHLYFAPREKADLAFMGNLWVALDSSYALRKIEVGIPKDINLNWVNEMQIEQEFQWVHSEKNTDNTNNTPPQYKTDFDVKNTGSTQNRALMLVKDAVFMDYGMGESKNKRSVLGRKTTSYTQFRINEPLADSLFSPAQKIVRPERVLPKDKKFWDENRPDTLNQREQGIVKTIDSLNNFKPFMRTMRVLRFLFDSYVTVGKVEIGSTNTFFSYNAIEGTRFRFGGRTNLKFSEKVLVDMYAAYGTRDMRWKGMGSLTYSFGKKEVRKYPLQQLKFTYKDDIKTPGQDQLDNLALSVQRGVNNRMIYTQTAAIEYLKEVRNGFAYSLFARNQRQEGAGLLKFDYLDSSETKMKKLVSSEIGIGFRYAPNEQFYQTPTYRTQILNRYPIFNINYSLGIKGALGGEYNYHTLKFTGEKVFYIAPFGQLEAAVEAGKTFGQVPYPLLTVHRANQTFFNQRESYNMMNFLEFVSDHYASINIYHNWQGFFFNRIPLLKKLQWREVITLKALWGGVTTQNSPNNRNRLLYLPTDENGQPITYTLNEKPYIEGSIGIGNIFRLIRIDYVQRFNYLDNPNVSKWGIRGKIKFEF
ncbi:MAG: DUF5686 family protein [Saprospiraceae bacterium]|nr:DUF5686 family protein [Saprospiraceae bacterium]